MVFRVLLENNVHLMSKNLLVDTWMEYMYIQQFP